MDQLSFSSEQYYRRYVTDLAAHYGIPERELAAFIEWREACRAFTSARHTAA
jgi:hypothetical protein